MAITNKSRSNGSTESVEPLKGLNRQGGSEEKPYVLPSFKRNFAEYRAEEAVNSNQYIDMGDYGSSHYDKKIRNTGQLQNLQDTRGYLQPWTHQFANGILKGGVLAGTSFLSGNVAMIDGLLNMSTVDPTTASAGDYLNAFTNNPVDLWLNDINNKMESILPNYETYAEQNTPWYQRLGTANVISNGFLKNTGFMIGAMYSGALWAKGLSAVSKINELRNAFKGISIVTKDGKNLDEASKVYKALLTGDVLADSEKGTKYLIGQAHKLRNAELGLRMKSGFLAAQGEAKLEAVQNTQDWLKLENQKIDDNTAQIKDVTLDSILMDSTKDNPLYTMSYDPNTGKEMPLLTKAGQEEYKKRLSAAEQQGIEAKAEAARKGQTMSNTIFLMNLPLLTFQDAWVYGRFMAGGFKSASMFEKMASRVNPKIGMKEAITDAVNTGKDVYKANKWLVASKIAKAASVPLSEGNEEMMQQSFATGAGNKASAAINEFYGYRMDKDAEEKAASTFNSFLQGVKQTYTDPNQWEQFTAGALMSFLGVPSFSKTRITDKNGKTVYDKQGNPTYTKPHLRLNTEFYNAIREAKSIKKEQSDIVNELNKTLKDPKFSNLWQSYIRENKLELDKLASVEANDMFSYKNKDMEQLLSSTEYFQKAGRLNDLRELLDNAENVTEQDLPQIKHDALNEETKKSVYDGVPDGEILKSYKEHAGEMKDFVNKFADIQEAIYGLYGRDIDDDIRESMSWQLMTISDVEDRVSKLSEETMPSLKKIIKTATDSIPDSPSTVTPDTLNLYNLADTHSRFSKSFLFDMQKIFDSLHNNLVNPDNISRGIEGLKNLREKLVSENAKEPNKDIDAELKYVDLRIAVNEAALNNGVGTEDFATVQRNLNDLIRLSNRRYDFLKLYHSLSSNPNLFTKAVQEGRKKRIEVYNTNKAADIFNKMRDAKSNEEMNDLYSQLDNEEQQGLVGDSINQSGIASVQNWKTDTTRKNIVLAAVVNALNGEDTDDETNNTIRNIINSAEIEKSDYESFVGRVADLIVQSSLPVKIKNKILEGIGKAAMAIKNDAKQESPTSQDNKGKGKGEEKGKGKGKEKDDSKDEDKSGGKVEDAGKTNPAPEPSTVEDTDRDNTYTSSDTINPEAAASAVSPVEDGSNPDGEVADVYGNNGSVNLEGAGTDTNSIAPSTGKDSSSNNSSRYENSLLGVAVTQFSIKEALQGKMTKLNYDAPENAGLKRIRDYLENKGAYRFLRYGGLNLVTPSTGKLKIYLGTIPYKEGEVTALSFKEGTNKQKVVNSTALLVEVPGSVIKKYYTPKDGNSSVFDKNLLYTINGVHYQVIGAVSNVGHENTKDNDTQDNTYSYIYGYYINGTYPNNINEHSISKRTDGKGNIIKDNHFTAEGKENDPKDALSLYLNNDGTIATTELDDALTLSGESEYDIDNPTSFATAFSDYVKTHNENSYGLGIIGDKSTLWAMGNGDNMAPKINIPEVVNKPGTMIFAAKGNNGKFYPFIINTSKLGSPVELKGNEVKNTAAYKYIKDKVKEFFDSKENEKKDEFRQFLYHHLSVKKEELSINDKEVTIEGLTFNNTDDLMTKLSEYYCLLNITACQYGRLCNSPSPNSLQEDSGKWFNALYDSGLITSIFKSFNRENSSFSIKAAPIWSNPKNEQGKFAGSKPAIINTATNSKVEVPEKAPEMYASKVTVKINTLDDSKKIEVTYDKDNEIHYGINEIYAMPLLNTAIDTGYKITDIDFIDIFPINNTSRILIARIKRNLVALTEYDDGTKGFKPIDNVPNDITDAKIREIVEKRIEEIKTKLNIINPNDEAKKASIKRNNVKVEKQETKPKTSKGVQPKKVTPSLDSTSPIAMLNSSKSGNGSDKAVSQSKGKVIISDGIQDLEKDSDEENASCSK